MASRAEIAELLTVAESAKTQVKRILAKIDARDRAQAVVIAYHSGLMELPGDPHHLARALRNLVDNAARHANSTVTIRAWNELTRAHRGRRRWAGYPCRRTASGSSTGSSAWTTAVPAAIAAPV